VSRRAAVGRAPRQAPYRRNYKSGAKVWVARYYDLNGSARYAKPRWNGGKSSFALKGDAQRAIDEALESLRGAAGLPKSLSAYNDDWLERHPRSSRTNKTNDDRVSYVLGVEIEGRPLGDWEFDEIGRPQVLALLDHMLRVEGRAARGARGILSVFSTMAEDAIGDKVATQNAFLGIRLRRNDPRIRKRPRQIRIWSFEEMRAFAEGGRREVRAATERPPDGRNRSRYKSKSRFYSPRDYEALILTPGFTGLRLGEFLALLESDFDGESFTFRFSAHEGELVESSDEKNHERTVPVPQTLAELIARSGSRFGTKQLYPTPTGKLWRERNFYRDVWMPAQLATGLNPTPHEFRHSYVTNLRAEKVDDADLAKVAGHTVETMVSTYTHALQRSHNRIREIIG
jgi:integrase